MDSKAIQYVIAALIAVSVATALDLQINATNANNASNVTSYNASLLYTGNGVAVTDTTMWLDDFESYEANYNLERNTYIPQISNVVAYYSFDGCNANDKTGTNNAVVTGATCQRGLVGNNSYSFDNTNDYINGSNTTTNYVATGRITNEVTLSAIVTPRINTGFSTGAIAGQYASAAAGSEQYGLYFSNSTKAFGWKTDTSYSQNSTSTGVYTVNVTYNVVGTYNGTSMCIYVDGALIGACKPQQGNITNLTNRPFTIGDRVASLSHITAFNGNIDEVILWSKGLTTSEVNQLYNRVNTTYRPVGGVAYNVTSGTVSIGNYGVGSVGDRALMCGIGSSCTVTKVFGFSGTPTVNYTVLAGSVTHTYTNNVLTLSMGAGSALDDLKVYVAQENVTSDSNLFCPALRTNSTSAVLSCNLYENSTLRSNLTDGLVAYYSFDEGWGFNDASGNNQNGTTTGVVGTSGLVGTGAALFNGSTASNITVPQNRLSNTSTVAWWGMLNAAGAAYAHNSILGVTNTYRNIDWRGSSSDDVVYETDTDTDLVIVCDGSNYAANVWYHFVIVRNGANISCYKNGAYVDSQILPINAENLTYSRIGAGYSTTGLMNGTLDEFRIYNRSLSASEARDLYNYGFPGAVVNGSSTSFYNYTNISLSSDERTTTGYYANSLVSQNIRSNIFYSAVNQNGLSTAFSVIPVSYALSIVAPYFDTHSASITGFAGVYNASMTPRPVLSTPSLVAPVSVGINTNWSVIVNSAGENVNVTFYHTVNDVLVYTDARTNISNGTTLTTLLTSGNYTTGSLVNITAEVFNGYVYGTNTSNGFILNNTAPVVTSVNITPNGTAEFTSGITSYCTATDADGDELFYNYTWYVNGSAVSSGTKYITNRLLYGGLNVTINESDIGTSNGVASTGLTKYGSELYFINAYDSALIKLNSTGGFVSRNVISDQGNGGAASAVSLINATHMYVLWLSPQPAISLHYVNGSYAGTKFDLDAGDWYATGLWYNNGLLYVADANSNNITVYNTTGGMVATTNYYEEVRNDAFQDVLSSNSFITGNGTHLWITLDASLNAFEFYANNLSYTGQNIDLSSYINVSGSYHGNYPFGIAYNTNSLYLLENVGTGSPEDGHAHIFEVGLINEGYSSGTPIQIDTIVAANTNISDVYRIDCSAYDGVVYSTAASSANTTIVDTTSPYINFEGVSPAPVIRTLSTFKVAVNELIGYINGSGIDTVWLNITKGTTVMLSSTNMTYKSPYNGVYDLYEYQYTIPESGGEYVVTFGVNDTSGNTNSTTYKFIISAYSGGGAGGGGEPEDTPPLVVGGDTGATAVNKPTIINTTFQSEIPRINTFAVITSRSNSLKAYDIFTNRELRSCEVLYTNNGTPVGSYTCSVNGSALHVEIDMAAAVEPISKVYEAKVMAYSVNGEAMSVPIKITTLSFVSTDGAGNLLFVKVGLFVVGAVLVVWGFYTVLKPRKELVRL